MNISLYTRPQGTDLIVNNNKVYQNMIDKGIDEFSFGLLMFINDYYWRDDYGQGRLKKVFSDFNEAEKHRKVYPCDADDDYDDCWSDKPIKITIKKQEQEGKIRIEVKPSDETIFDILHPEDINNIIPV
jgi:hypothetical protein